MRTGEYRCSLDEKGRIMVPARIRSEVAGNTIVLTRGIDPCLWLFPPDAWQTISEKVIGSTSLFQERFRLVQRRIIAPSQDVEIDGSGRIVIPPTLRDAAGLRKECTVLGMIYYFEIWDEERYREYLEANEEKFKAAAEELSITFG